jgi:hypothetical protein
LNEEDKKLFVKSAVVMFKSFLSDCERVGLGNLRVHSALDRGEFLEHIVIQNQISSLKTLPKFIELNVYQNMTLWELKVIVA